MRLRLFTSILTATGLLAFASDPAPQMTDISQKAAKPGEIITVSGQGLNSKNIDEIYLTDHKFDMRVKVLEQTQTTVKFRVPPFAKPGRTQLLFLTKGDEPKLLEQPVYLLIEDPETEVASARPPLEPGKQESVKTAEAKAEVTNTEVTNTEVTNTEVTNTELSKSEPAKEQTTKADPVNLDQPKLDQVKPVLAKPDLTKPDATKPDLAKQQDPRQPNL
jgi:IPT/TIG domain-containing protein